MVISLVVPGALQGVSTMLETTAGMLLNQELQTSAYSNSTRINQAINIPLNLDRNSAWLLGMGIGTRWQEIVPAPPDFAAYTSEKFESNWHVVIHNPIYHVLFRFGLVGTMLLIAAELLAVLRYLETMRATPSPWQRAQIVALMSAWVPLSFWAHFLKPTTGFVVGILMGLLELGRVYWGQRDGINAK